jgi:uncharacterized protein DUF4872/butirosin biosynthesis protein H-like
MSDNNWKIVKNFPHSEGGHCESTTLRDHVNFLGYNLSESMLFGLDATMGFTFLGLDSKYGSFYIGGKQDGLKESSLACRLLGIQVEKRDFRNEQDAWADAVALLQKNIPLIIQADMAYLSYLDMPESIDDFHFGAHIFSLIGYNSHSEMALACDNGFEKPVEIKIKDLSKARNSKEGAKFLLPHNTRYVLNRRPDGKRPPLGAAVKMAVKQVVNNMLSPSVNVHGLSALKLFKNSIQDWKTYFSGKMDEFQSFLENVYGYIEEYGTGGAIFRKLYAQFFQDILKNDEILNGKRAFSPQDVELIQNQIPNITKSAEKWTEFAKILLEFSKMDMTDALGKMNYQKLESILEEIIEAEETFFTGLRDLKL